jgi:hypothetical protein
VIKPGRVERSRPLPSRRAGAILYFWKCRCDCGTEREVLSSRLRHGETQSCGCFQRERASEASITHGASRDERTLAYRSWLEMRRRCRPESVERYPAYAGVVRICERWDDFKLFLEDMGECPPYHSLDRRDNEDGYNPKNCRWATCQQQSENRRSTRFLTFNGETLPMGKWAKRLGISSSGLKYRLDKFKWSLEKSLTTKNHQTKPRTRQHRYA